LLENYSVLIIGGGSIGQRHILNLKKIGLCQIYVLKRKHDYKFQEKFNVIVITNVNELVNKKIDATFICTPTSLHLEGILIAKKLNSHVFVEKPLTNNKSTLNQIKKINFNNKVFFIGFMLRFHPSFLIIKKLINNNRIGKWYNARFEFGSWLPNWHPNENYKLGYAARRDMGGGVINTISHELDMILNLFGVPKNIKGFKKNLNILEIDVEEITELVFDYPLGLISLHLDYLQKDYDRRVRILGSEGSINWDWHSKEIVVTNTGGIKEIIKEPLGFEVNDLYVDEIKYFFELIHNNQKINSFDLEYSILNTEIILKIHNKT